MIDISFGGSGIMVDESLNGLMEAREEILKLDPFTFVTIETGGGNTVFAGDAIKIPFDSFAESLNPFPEKELILGTPGDDHITINRDDDVYVFAGSGNDTINVLVERSGEGGQPVIDGGSDFDTLVAQQSLGVPANVFPHEQGESIDFLFGSGLVSADNVEVFEDDGGGSLIMDLNIFPAF